MANNKVKVYECLHYEYDDLGKYTWRHSKDMNCRECKFKHIYAQQVCPCYKRGKLRGEWITQGQEVEEAKEFKKQQTKELQKSKKQLGDLYMGI